MKGIFIGQQKSEQVIRLLQAGIAQVEISRAMLLPESTISVIKSRYAMSLIDRRSKQQWSIDKRKYNNRWSK